MIAYFVKSGLCLAILLAFYHWILEREKMHQFNRFYLLGSLLFSLLIPFAIIYVEAQPQIIEEISVATFPKNDTVQNQEFLPDNSFSWAQYFLIGYVLISFLFLVRFLKSLLDLLLKTKTNEVVRYRNAKLVLVEDDIIPHTFWNYIFINKKEYQNQKVEKELFTHELTHATQKHTLDIILVETLQIAFWFNPFFYPLKKAIQLNHEFLADDKVIASHHDIPKYQYLLLDKAAWKNNYYLASNLNYSLTKKRLLMMKTPKSKSILLWKKLTIVPLLAGLFMLFADRVEAQTKEGKPQIIELKDPSKKATQEEMDVYNDILNTSLKNKMFKVVDIQKLKLIYDRMSDTQKQSVKNYNDVLPPPPPPISLAKLTPQKYEEFKNEKEYAVWLDGKSIKNSELNSYNASHFYTHLISYVEKNARSQKFPQPHQVQLYTEDYYKSLSPDSILMQPENPKKPTAPEKISVEIKEVLPPPPPKKEQERKAKKLLKKEKEEVEWIEEKEIKEEIEIKEVPEGVEEVEEEIEVKREVPQLKKKEVVEILHSKDHKHEEHEDEILHKDKEHIDAKSLKDTYKELVKDKATFYVNGKKMSAKDAKKYFYKNTKELQTLDVTKNNNGTTVRLITQ